MFVNGERVAGYVPESELRAAVDRQLSYQDRTRREGLKVNANSSR